MQDKVQECRAEIYIYITTLNNISLKFLYTMCVQLILKFTQKQSRKFTIEYKLNFELVSNIKTTFK